LLFIKEKNEGSDIVICFYEWQHKRKIFLIIELKGADDDFYLIRNNENFQKLTIQTVIDEVTKGSKKAVNTGKLFGPQEKKTHQIFDTYLTNINENEQAYIYCGITFKDIPIDGNNNMFENKDGNCLGVILNVGIKQFATLCGGLFATIDGFWCAYLSRLDIQLQNIDEDSNKNDEKEAIDKVNHPNNLIHMLESFKSAKRHKKKSLKKEISDTIIQMHQSNKQELERQIKNNKHLINKQIVNKLSSIAKEIIMEFLK